MATDTPAGAIHDIGYRHYDGERLGRTHARTALLVDTFRAAFGLGRTTRAKVAPMLLLGVSCFPALIWVTVAGVVGMKQLPVGFAEFVVITQVLISIFVAVLAPGAVSRDLRFRTMSLYRSRPMRASDYVLAKLLASIGALLTFMLIPQLILYLGGALAEISARDELADFARGVVMVVLLSLLLAPFGLLVAALTPRRGMGTAAIITVLLVAAGGHVFLTAVGMDIGNDSLATWSRLLSPFALADGIVSGVLDGMNVFPEPPIGVAECAAFVGVYVALVAGTTALLFARLRRVTVA